MVLFLRRSKLLRERTSSIFPFGNKVVLQLKGFIRLHKVPLIGGFPEREQSDLSSKYLESTVACLVSIPISNHCCCVLISNPLLFDMISNLLSPWLLNCGLLILWRAMPPQII